MDDINCSDPNKMDEEDKISISPISYSNQIKLHSNPLINNKGLPRKEPPQIIKCKSKQFTATYSKECKSPIHATTEKHDFGQFNLGTKGDSINKLLKVPAFNPDQEIEPPVKKEETKKKEDGLLAVQEDATIDLEKGMMPFKSASMAPEKHEGIESFAEDLSPKQCAFLKEVYSCNPNYFQHALNIQDISYQYVTIMNEVCKFTDTDMVLNQISNLIDLSKYYPKKPEHASNL